MKASMRAPATTTSFRMLVGVHGAQGVAALAFLQFIQCACHGRRLAGDAAGREGRQEEIEGAFLSSARGSTDASQQAVMHV
eukprot:4940347-Pleurochrysis_carterae.AAC.1